MFIRDNEMIQRIFTDENRDITYEVLQYLHGSDLLTFSAISTSCARLCEPILKERILPLCDAGVDLRFDDHPYFWKKEYIRVYRSKKHQCAFCETHVGSIWFVTTTGRHQHLKICPPCSRTKLTYKAMLKWHRFDSSVLSKMPQGTIHGKLRYIISDAIDLGGMRHFRQGTLFHCILLAVTPVIFCSVLILTLLSITVLNLRGYSALFFFLEPAVIYVMLYASKAVYARKEIRKRVKEGRVAEEFINCPKE
eukprot:TRINITY_DN10414_c0_g1_i1.p1 TRINITY_DN10414_c0_g1~~TRINITY_DN10414_c0_g1_i1.p1  ORF type:complete len:251 (-),score=32.23 TRINITY_DN10414_c0_g1_i1:139-891(-)